MKNGLIVALVILLAIVLWRVYELQTDYDNMHKYYTSEISQERNESYNNQIQLDCLGQIWFLWISDKAPSLNESKYEEVFSDRIMFGNKIDYASKSASLKTHPWLDGIVAAFSDVANKSIDCGIPNK